MDSVQISIPKSGYYSGDVIEVDITVCLGKSTPIIQLETNFIGEEIIEKGFNYSKNLFLFYRNILYSNDKVYKNKNNLINIFKSNIKIDEDVEWKGFHTFSTELKLPSILPRTTLEIDYFSINYTLVLIMKTKTMNGDIMLSKKVPINILGIGIDFINYQKYLIPPNIKEQTNMNIFFSKYKFNVDFSLNSQIFEGGIVNNKKRRDD
jgi:hypothetical protein